MSQQKISKDFITNRKLLERLLRLDVVKSFSVSVVVAYIGLLLVNKGKAIDIPTAYKLIKNSKLDLKIKANGAIPCSNILEALIHLVIYKRKLLKHFFKHQEYQVWNYEHSAPLFDIMHEISKIYKI